MEEKQLATLKKAGTIEKVSREEFEYRIKSIAKAKRDIVWWAENFFHIISTDEGLMPIKLYDKQKDLLRSFSENNRTIVLASRQTGKCIAKNTWVKLKYKPLNITIKLPVGIFYYFVRFLKKVR